jgi:uncharacterized coiled-coil protein SlyX
MTERGDERLERLESVVGFQERLISQLNEVVSDLAMRLEAMEREVKRLGEREAPEVGPHHDPPPHY